MPFINSIIDAIKRHFLSGVLVIVPFILTFIVLRFLFEAVDGILEPYLHDLLGYYRTGLGVATTLLLILLAGILTRNLIGHRLYSIGDRIVARVPLIRLIYSASKQLLEAVAGNDKGAFKEVALIEYPRKGLYSICFISQRIKIEIKGESRNYATCFVASTPTPVSGMTVIVPVEELIPVDMNVEAGIKFLVSGGVASPSLIKSKPDTGMDNNKRVTNEAG